MSGKRDRLVVVRQVDILVVVRDDSALARFDDAMKGLLYTGPRASVWMRAGLRGGSTTARLSTVFERITSMFAVEGTSRFQNRLDRRTPSSSVSTSRAPTPWQAVRAERIDRSRLPSQPCRDLLYITRVAGSRDDLRPWVGADAMIVWATPGTAARPQSSAPWTATGVSGWGWVGPPWPSWPPWDHPQQ